MLLPPDPAPAFAVIVDLVRYPIDLDVRLIAAILVSQRGSSYGSGTIGGFLPVILGLRPPLAKYASAALPMPCVQT